MIYKSAFSEPVLEDEIENLRDNLINEFNDKGDLCQIDVLEKSRELDKLLNRFNSISNY